MIRQRLRRRRHGILDDMPCDAQLLGSADETTGEVHLSLVVSGDAQRVWAALTSAGELPAWIGRLAGSPLEAGSEFDLWHEEAVKSSHVVERWGPPTLLELTWDFPDETPSRVTFHLDAQVDANTLVTVEHRGLDDPICYAAGWHRHLTYLASHLNGQDLAWENFWDGFDALADKYRTGTERASSRHPNDR